jgi:hypothetical protein
MASIAARRSAAEVLQVRTWVLNDELADNFHRWFPGFTYTAPDRQAPTA